MLVMMLLSFREISAFFFFFFPVNPHRLQCRGRKRETTMASTMSLRQAGRSLAGLARTNLNKTKQGVRNMSGGSYEEELGECCYVTQSRDEQDRREKNDKRKRERERASDCAGAATQASERVYGD